MAQQTERERTEAIFEARRAERYGRHQAEVTSGHERLEERIARPAEGGTRYIEPGRMPMLRRVAQLLRRT
jgi:hypothetical protein